MRILISKLGRQLHGSAEGRQHFAEICGQIAEAQRGCAVVLDFNGVESVTGSWIDAVIGQLFRWPVDQNEFYIVLVNFPDKALDELQLVARANQQCYPLATEFTDTFRHVRLVGPLDSGLRATVMKLVELGGATGAELARQVPTEKIQPTAWNNRLKDLYERRLLNRKKQGRQQIYFPIADEIEID